MLLFFENTISPPSAAEGQQPSLKLLETQLKEEASRNRDLQAEKCNSVVPAFGVPTALTRFGPLRPTFWNWDRTQLP